MSVRCRRGDAANYGREKPFPFIALSAAVAAAGLSLAAIVGKGRRRAHRARLCKATQLSSPASGDCVSHVHDQSAPLGNAAAGASSWAIQVYQPWSLSILVLAFELPTQGCAPAQRSPKAHFKDALGSDDDRFAAKVSDSDVYGSDTGAATAFLAPSPAIGDPTEVSDDAVKYYEPHDLGLELDAAVEGAVEPDDLSLAASLAIHEPYPPADTPTETTMIPNTPDSVSILPPPPPPPPPRSSRVPRSCSSLSHLRRAESWTSIETGLAELPQQREESRGSLAVNLHDDDLRFADEALGRTRGVTGLAERLSLDDPRDGLVSSDWALAAGSVSSVSSGISCGEDGDDSSSSTGGGDSCPSSSSQRGFTSDGSSLDLPEPDAPDGADVTVTVTMGNPLYRKNTGSSSSSNSSSAVSDADGVAGAVGRACRRLSFELQITSVDNPCFAAAATTVNNPCFGSDALEGAVPALLQPYSVAAAARHDPLAAFASPPGAQWHPCNPLAEERSPFRTQSKQQTQQQSVVVEAKVAMAGTTEAAEADVPAPPVTPAKPPPPLASATPASPISTPRPSPEALPYWRIPAAAAPLTDTTVPTSPVPPAAAAAAADAAAAAVAAACAASVASGTHAAAPLPCCLLPTERSAAGDPLSPPALEAPAPLLPQPLPSTADSRSAVEAPPNGRSSSDPAAPRPGPGPANRPPWRPAACPYKAPGGIAGALTAAVAGRPGSSRSSAPLSTAASAARGADQALKSRSPCPAQSTALPPQRPPFRPPSRCSAGFHAQAGGATTRGSAARKSVEWAPGTPSFLRPTQASLAAAAANIGDSIAGSVAGSRMGGTVMETGGRRGEVQRPADNRPRWR